MRVRLRLVVVAWVGGGIAVACLLPAVDELSGSGADASVADAARETAPPADTCDATFCDDFDRTALGATWTEARGLDAGLATLGAPAVSPPNALRIAIADGGNRTFALVKDLAKGSALRCDFSLRADVVPATAQDSADILSFYWAGSGSIVDADVLLSLSKAGLSLREDVGFTDGGCACPSFVVPPIPIAGSVFVRVGVAIDFATAHLYVNDTEVSAHAITGNGAVPVRVTFGVDRPGQPTDVRLDDFSCRLAP